MPSVLRHSLAAVSPSRSHFANRSASARPPQPLRSHYLSLVQRGRGVYGPLPGTIKIVAGFLCSGAHQCSTQHASSTTASAATVRFRGARPLYCKRISMHHRHIGHRTEPHTLLHSTPLDRPSPTGVSRRSRSLQERQIADELPRELCYLHASPGPPALMLERPLRGRFLRGQAALCFRWAHRNRPAARASFIKNHYNFETIQTPFSDSDVCCIHGQRFCGVQEVCRSGSVGTRGPIIIPTVSTVSAAVHVGLKIELSAGALAAGAT